MHTQRDYPRFTVNKKAEAAIRRGHPWVYGEEVIQRPAAYENGGLGDVVTEKGVYLDTPKNGKVRNINVAPEVMALLKQLRTNEGVIKLSPYVFTQEGTAEPMHPQSPTRYMQKFAARYGIQELHPHKLRHSFASIAITNGADIASVSEILGHSDKAVTLRMYTHADQASMTRASNIFREAIKRKQA